MPHAYAGYAQIRPWLVSGKGLAVLAGAVFAILIAIDLGRSFAALEAEPAPVAVSQTDTAAPDLRQAVVSAQLFGAATGSPSGNLARPLPETSLQLTLRGAFAGTSPDSGSAIIELPGGVTRSVQAGRSIDRDTRLQAVHSDHIVLERNGQRETLYFPQFDAPGSAAAAALAEAGPYAGPYTPAGSGMNPDQGADQDAGAATAPLRSASEAATASTTNADQRREMIRQRLEELRQRASSNRVMP